jgi:hypothetical protein
MTSETKVYENVTLYVCTMFGFHPTLCKSVEVTTGVKYAQHENATRVTFVEKGKRKIRGFISYGFGSGGGRENSFIILDGFHPDFTGGWLIPTADGNRISAHASCDRQWDYDFNKALDRYTGEISGEVEILHDARWTTAFAAPVAEEVAA